MSSKKEVVIGLITPVIEALGCELWGLELLQQGQHSVLRIYIEKENGVDLEDCERVSRQISSVMDVDDPISSKYTLEVSSPGMDRSLYTLDQFQRFIGEQVLIKLSRTFGKRKKMQGVLTAVENDEVVVQIDDEEYLLPIELIEKANIVPRF